MIALNWVGGCDNHVCVRKKNEIERFENGNC